MSWDFKPGMKVVRLNGPVVTRRGYSIKPNLPRAGGVYTIESVGTWNGFVILRLIELPNKHFTFPGGVEPGFRSEYFRPVLTTNIDALKAHLAPKPILAEV